MNGILPLVIFLTTSLALAQITDCNSIASSKDLYSCLVNTNLSVKKSQAELDSVKFLKEKAKQRLNPELEAQYYAVDSKKLANTLGQPTSQWTAGIMIPMELGGKIPSRVKEAENQANVKKEEINLNLTEIKKSVITTLFRLQQIVQEKTNVNEAITTFDTLLKQYGLRNTLSPEQEVINSVLRIAQEDYKLKLIRLVLEEKELARQITSNSNLSTTVITQWLPKPKKDWPEVETQINTASAPLIRTLNAELELSKSRFDLARSESFPDLRVGPLYNQQTQGGQNINFYGVGVAIPLPVFNRNIGGRNYAKSQFDLATLNLAQTSKLETTKVNQLISFYNDLAKLLSSLPSYDLLEKDHKKIEKHFNKGIIPGTLVLETHRQLYEQLKFRHENEQVALGLLVEIKILSGEEPGDIL